MTTRTYLNAMCAALALAFAAPAAQVHAAPAHAHGAQAASAQQQLDRLADEYYAAGIRFDPLGATESGNPAYDDKLGSIAPAARARVYAEFHAFDKRLARIDRNALDHQGQVSYDIMADELQRAFALEPFPEEMLPMHQLFSVPLTLASYAGGQSNQALGTTTQYRAYLKRLTLLPAWIDQAIVNMRAGMRTGVTQPRALVRKMLRQVQSMVSGAPEKNLFYTPITNLPAAMSEQDKAALTRDYREVIANKLNPSLAHLAVFLEKEYLPAARTTDGMSGLPNGAAWYQAQIRNHTTTTMTADQIHELGLKQVAQIQQELAALGTRMGYHGESAGMPAWYEKQGAYRIFHNDEEVLAAYRQLDALLVSKLPALFNHMPKARVDVRMEPEVTRSAATDHYTPAAADGSRPGIFYAVVMDPTTYDSARTTTLFMHEAIPGHHFQSSLQRETKMPAFRAFGGSTAYAEGWALYSETLGRDLGLFDQPEKLYGHLNYALMRAVRLVVDTGVHAKGWSREKAIAYMVDTLGYGEAEATVAVERYMAWPAQALAYKIGELKIQELRGRAAQALGPKFRLADFHDVVLEDGMMPLSLLESKVDHWIAANR